MASGQTTSATFRPKDAAGNAIFNPALTVQLSASGGSSAGTFSAPSYVSVTGYYSSTFTATTAGTATTLSTTVNTQALTSTAPILTVVPGDLYELTYSGLSSSWVSGSSQGLAVQAKDINGNIISIQSGSATIAIKSGTGVAGATLGGTLTAAFSSGVANFSGLTLDKAGSAMFLCYLQARKQRIQVQLP